MVRERLILEEACGVAVQPAVRLESRMERGIACTVRPIVCDGLSPIYTRVPGYHDKE